MGKENHTALLRRLLVLEYARSQREEEKLEEKNAVLECKSSPGEDPYRYLMPFAVLKIQNPSS